MSARLTPRAVQPVASCIRCFKDPRTLVFWRDLKSYLLLA